MIQNNPNEDPEIKRLEAMLASMEEQLRLEEQIVAELDQQLAEAKRTVLGLEHDISGTKGVLTKKRMTPIIIGS